MREILALDSSEIQVHGSLFSIPFWKKKFCLGHQASAKLHLVWNVCGEWVEDFIVTPGRKNDSPFASLLKLLPGKTYVFDRAYNDLSFWYKIICAKSYFVTSDWKASASEIADIYKKRWAVELVFKWLKGHLNIRYLASKSVNALKVQLAIAVLLPLLLQLKRLKEKFKGTLWGRLRLIRASQIQKNLCSSGNHGAYCRECTSTAEVKT